jgi:hypothetical protein
MSKFMININLVALVLNAKCTSIKEKLVHKIQKGWDIMKRLVHYHKNGDQNCKALVDISRI